MEKTLPENWKTVGFTEVFDINGGTQPPKSQFVSEPKDGYIRLLQIRDFGKKPVPTYIPNTGKLRTCEKDDILIARYGASIGRIVSNQEGAYNVALAKVNIPNVMNKNFVKWLLKSHIFQNKIASFQRTAQSGFNKDDLSSINIPLPPLKEQERIVAKLDTLFTHLEGLKTRLETIPKLLKNFKQAVLTQAVTGKLTKDWRVGKELDAKIIFSSIKQFRKEEYIRLCKKAVTEKKRKPKKPILSIELESKLDLDIPENWVKCFIGDVGEVCNGSTPSRKLKEYWNGNIPWVSSGLVQNGRIDSTEEYITQLGFENSSVRMLPKGSVLIAMVGEGKTRGQSAILDIDATTNQNIAGIILNHKMLKPEYLFYWFNFRYEVTRLAGNGSGPKALNGQKVRELNFALPPLKEQAEIVNSVEHLFAKADKIEAQYKVLKQKIDNLPQAILAKAFKGELVPQLDTDGTAKDLLAEIQELKASMQTKKKKTVRKKKSNV